MTNTVHPIMNETFSKQISISGDSIGVLNLSVGSVFVNDVKIDDTKAVYITLDMSKNYVKAIDGIAFIYDRTSIAVVLDSVLFGAIEHLAKQNPDAIGYDRHINAWQIADDYPGKDSEDSNIVSELKDKLDTLLFEKDKSFDGFMYLFEPEALSIGDPYIRF